MLHKTKAHNTCICTNIDTTAITIATIIATTNTSTTTTYTATTWSMLARRVAAPEKALPTLSQQPFQQLSWFTYQGWPVTDDEPPQLFTSQRLPWISAATYCEHTWRQLHRGRQRHKHGSAPADGLPLRARRRWILYARPERGAHSE